MARAIGLILLLAGCEYAQINLLAGDGLPPLNKGDTIPGLISIEIQPPSATVTSDGRPPGETVTFVAIGTFDGGTRDITSEVRWSISALGSIEGGAVVTDETVGGNAIVRATAGAIEASAELAIRLDVVEPVGGAAEFPDDTGGDSAGAITIIYPAPDTTFPSNVNHVLHQWGSTLSSPLYEVRFESSIARIRIHTRDPHYRLDDLSSGWIARTHAGRSVTMTVRAVEDGSAAIHRSAPRVLNYAGSEIRGSALYWSSTAQAIKQASLMNPRAVRVLPLQEGECVSCHALSRDGTQIAAALDGDEIGLFEEDDGRSFDEDREYGYSTFSPDGEMLLVAHDGDLLLYDLEGGSPDQVQLGDGMIATQPDWSPDGDHVVLAVRDAQDSFDDKKFSGTSIARIEWDDGDFDHLEILVPSGGDTLSFPSYSPDGRFIAFVRSSASSKDDPTSRIELIAADGNSPPLALAVLNAGSGNTIPTWASTSEPSIQWIVFSSTRDYGSVLVGAGRDQLWVSAIDADRAAAGSDPSSPAFWLPFQDPEEHNHRALWSPLPGPPTSACQPALESCNGRDDDCDLATDEGCGCAVIEICGNAADDDCDTLTDEEDEDC